MITHLESRKLMFYALLAPISFAPPKLTLGRLSFHPQRDPDADRLLGILWQPLFPQFNSQRHPHQHRKDK